MIGGDSGQGCTKLGVCYESAGKRRYLPLIVATHNDHATGLAGIKAAVPAIWQALQAALDEQRSVLTGDWVFINAVLGLQSPRQLGHGKRLPALDAAAADSRAHSRGLDAR